MYNEKIEGLISAALADGVLTEKEKQILFKRAQDEGIDLDEFEMVLDARLVELEKAEKEKAEKSAPKSSKYGDIRKCPACGAIVPALSGICPECGYEFSNIDSNLSSKKLSDKIDSILQAANAQKMELKKSGTLSTERKGINSSPLEHECYEIDKDARKQIENAISTFAIPNSKSDLFEFIVALQPKINGENGAVYLQKLNEACLKAKTLFPNDPMISTLISNRENRIKEKAKNKRKKLLISVPIAVIVSLAILYFEWTLLDWKWGWKLLLAIYTVPLPIMAGVMPFMDDSNE